MPPGLEAAFAPARADLHPFDQAEHGLHDENINFEQCCSLVGAEMAGKLCAATLGFTSSPASVLDERGIHPGRPPSSSCGMRQGQMMLVDEALTPDLRASGSTRLLRGRRRADLLRLKQYVRDYLETTGWIKEPPAPVRSTADVDSQPLAHVTPRSSRKSPAGLYALEPVGSLEFGRC